VSIIGSQVKETSGVYY